MQGGEIADGINPAAKQRADYAKTYQQVTDNASKVKELFAARGIRLHDQSTLGRLMKQAEQLAVEWTSSEREEGWRDRLFAAMNVSRISSAMLGLADDSGAGEAFKRIASKDMNLAEHEQSQGKDAFFEVELADYLKRYGSPARLAEPDILVKLSWGDYPIACKKINSLGNLEDQIRKAGKQLRPQGGAGLIALNLDVLIPEDSMMIKHDAEGATSELVRTLDDFRLSHLEALQRPVRAEACDAVLLCISCMAEIETMSPSFVYYTQTDVLAVQGVNPEGGKRAFELAKAIHEAKMSHRAAVAAAWTQEAKQ